MMDGEPMGRVTAAALEFLVVVFYVALFAWIFRDSLRAWHRKRTLTAPPKSRSKNRKSAT